ncbi:PREDICTED: muscle, skeletal receptor tyrosine-protein kinase-like [Priapulus caudatus]|uniref:Muscle, skeletal receptor tyrosine-protein kinase-like n=1 Tax=Priapulus caudatus TaxID=37621 RepID=A0ABM1DN94_PRICU|nr:PREDICTED: muscle, skeletal receptor tyrosine-protein kinase-like [Priapulus caudatus]
MTIECQVKGDPKPTASWIFDDKTLSDVKEKYKMPVVELGDNKWALRLTIFNIVKTDTGRYKCTAKNKYGSCHGSVSVQM